MITKVLVQRENDTSTLLEVTITFRVRSSMKKILKKTPFISDLSSILSKKGIETVSMSSRIKKVEGETEDYKRSIMTDKKFRKATKPNVSEKIKKHTMNAVAHFSPSLKHGVVYTNDNTYVIEVGKMYQPEEAGTTHLGMWMQGPDDLQKMKAGAYPFRNVYDSMKKKSDKFLAEILSRISKED